jgi:hypothetical protein
LISPAAICGKKAPAARTPTPAHTTTATPTFTPTKAGTVAAPPLSPPDASTVLGGHHKRHRRDREPWFGSDACYTNDDTKKAVTVGKFSPHLPRGWCGVLVGLQWVGWCGCLCPGCADAQVFGVRDYVTPPSPQRLMQTFAPPTPPHEHKGGAFGKADADARVCPPPPPRTHEHRSGTLSQADDSGCHRRRHRQSNRCRSKMVC